MNDPNLDGSWANDDFSAFTGNVTLIEGVDPTVWHEIELRLTYVDGPDNDVMEVIRRRADRHVEQLRELS